MKILAIDSSSLVASVAVVTDDILTAEYTINFKKTHSQTLLPMIDEISKMIELDMETIDANSNNRRTGFIYRTTYRKRYSKRIWD